MRFMAFICVLHLQMRLKLQPKDVQQICREGKARSPEYLARTLRICVSFRSACGKERIQTMESARTPGYFTVASIAGQYKPDPRAGISLPNARAWKNLLVTSETPA